MMVIRYFVEHLPAHENPHHTSQRSVVHFHCKEHHWMRIDATTIVGVGHFRSSESMSNVRDYPTVLVLPHLHDRTAMKKVFDDKTQVHPAFADKYNSLKNQFGMKPTDSTSDLIGRLIDSGHYQFEPHS